ncbi:MAG TPA: hypothetical protein VD908_09150 [Cytophagales bacterium]|nr:hypothetical protein [Cytophagales bacterium]
MEAIKVIRKLIKADWGKYLASLIFFCIFYNTGLLSYPVSTMSVPIITIDDTGVTKFDALPGQSFDQMYIVRGSDFTTGQIITVTVADTSGSFTISDNGSDFYTTLAFTPDELVEGFFEKQLMIRFAPSDEEPHTAMINHSADGAETKTLTVYGNPDPMPIEWQSFKAKPSQESIVLSWSSVSEISTSYFEIEVTENPETGFGKIGRVDVNDENPEIAKGYTFNHYPEVITDTYYYRLKHVNTDGALTYSKVISVEPPVELKVEVEVAPNPIVTSSQLKITSPESGIINIIILNREGLEIFYESYSIMAGVNNIDLPLDKLVAAGVYTLITKIQGEMGWQKLIKQY